MTFRLLLFAGLASAGICLIPAPAVATSLAPAPTYTIVAGGGQYVFVMHGYRRTPGDDFDTRPETIAIRAAYPRSGMYRNDDTKALLWAFGEPDQYVYREAVDVLPDADHLVVHERGGSSPVEIVLSFYARGVKLHSYPARELVSWWSVAPNKRSARHPYFEYLESVGFDAAALECIVRTHDGNRFVFDVRTGRIVSVERWSPWVGIALVVAVLIATCLAVPLYFQGRGRVVPRWATPAACVVGAIVGSAWVYGTDPGVVALLVVMAGCAVLVGVRVRRHYSTRPTGLPSQSGSA